MSKKDHKLSLMDACGMAIGGMVGGGIFAVLGEAVMTAGNAAFISLGMGGILAMITGLVYARLTVKFDEAGGEFIFIERIAGARFAGTVSWFLILGYIFTISLYAYTFGAYAGRLAGLDPSFNYILGGGVVVLITILNLSGVRSSGISEDILVYTKIFILAGLIALGFTTVQSTDVLPIANNGMDNIIQAAALVFVAYEGFQLLTYDYDDIRSHKKNLPKAVVYSISIVILIYVLIAFVLTGSQNAEAIASHKETALALIAEPVLGRPGVVIVLVAAVFSTASAILATIFAISRMGKRISSGGQLPVQLTNKQSHGVPVWFSILIALAAIAIQAQGNLGEITTYSSLVFLMVFSVVNYMGFRHRVFDGWKNLIPLAGSFGCLSATGVLVWHTYTSEGNTLLIIGGISLLLIVLRELYVWLHPAYKENKV